MNDEWVRLTLGDTAVVQRGISYNSDQTSGDGEVVPFLNLKSIDRGGGYRDDGIKWYSGPVKESQRLSAGDLLVANTDLTRERAILGAPVLVPNGLSNATYSHHLSRLILKDPTQIEPGFLYLVLQSEDVRNHLIACGRGTTVMGVSKQDIERTSILLPPLVVQRRIVDLMSHLDAHIANFGFTLGSGAQQGSEANALSVVRRALLKNLLSGDTEIPSKYDVKFLRGI